MHSGAVFLSVSLKASMRNTSYAQQLCKASCFHTYVTLIQTVYRAVLTSAVSGVGHGFIPLRKEACIGNVYLRSDLPSKIGLHCVLDLHL